MAGHRKENGRFLSREEEAEYSEVEGGGSWEAPEGFDLLGPDVPVTLENVGPMLEQLELAAVAELRRKLMLEAKGKPREMMGTIREISVLRTAMARRKASGSDRQDGGAHPGVPGLDRSGLRDRLAESVGEAADGEEGTESDGD